MSQDARVPSVYRLVAVARADDVAETARTLAAGGAEDGTLVWDPHDATERTPADFACAVVLRPECEVETAMQLAYVGTLGLVEALGVLLPPAPLLIAWPGTLMLKDAAIAEVRLETAPDRADSEGNWVLLLVRVQIGLRQPRDLERLTSLCDEGCTTMVRWKRAPLYVA